ncbi:hypothetical protein STSP2_01895 [Anaerohalosphaera lusitana]|uniref:Uncharacterized protein n=1 Tax=Anaerohalosphaera lusitana TaxID=1936003 RepID=A0A1U9NLA9_9BACT|nr:hypothetical protein [Anaerohalosphaera lusitana]AQT68723.1 hypothetical protein STSP2_01895 [Anaerohalosphaera lusitana]
MNPTKEKLKIAARLQQALITGRCNRLIETSHRTQRFADMAAHIMKNSHKLELAAVRGWHGAAKKCLSRIDRLCLEINYWISANKETLAPPRTKTPTIRQLIEELDQIEADCGGFRFDPPRDTLSVTTAPITLEGVYLGPFEISLYIEGLTSSDNRSKYYVTALDPHPAASESAVTHPHISNELVCEGDGTVPIRKALEQGRFADFFSMVESILKVYNPESPYIPIEDWEGISCYECGFITDPDHTLYCEFCGYDFCQGCVMFCQCCRQITACISCQDECIDCGDTICPDCTRTCSECGDNFCVKCIGEDICRDCLAERSNENGQEKQNDSQDQITIENS